MGLEDYSEMTVQRKTIHQAEGTDNVLADLGFDDADQLAAKASLAVKGKALLEDLEAFFAESDRHLTPAARELTEADVARLVRESR